MGIYNRDYIREDRPGRLTRSDESVLPWIIGFNVAVYVLNVMSEGTVNAWLRLDPRFLTSRFEIWRLLSYGFCHANTGHIFFNMYALWLFGKFVEPIFGAREFLTFYLTGILAAAVGFLIFAAVKQQPMSSVGASGGVMAVTILAAMHFPRMEVLLMLVLPIQLRYLAIGVVLIDVLGVVEQRSNVANAAHLGGAAFGFLYGRMGWRLTGWFGRWRSTFRRKPDVRIFHPEPDQPGDVVPEETVDRLLKKISEQGESSLTDHERELLALASRQARRRQNRS